MRLVLSVKGQFTLLQACLYCFGADVHQSAMQRDEKVKPLTGDITEDRS